MTNESPPLVTLQELIEQGIPEDMARRLVVLGNRKITDAAITTFNETGEWSDLSGGGVFTSPNESDKSDNREVL